ncbi:MAG: transporter substrate-binding domain-containing protein [Candidatus Thiodiazotropha sp. (ex Dulcina madagascariensis)]|nr:transporter substrate-binding domain-containing protein [Candidatus Thiodiazotropha sp. (ex Dulcina madagascariensis)]
MTPSGSIMQHRPCAGCRSSLALVILSGFLFLMAMTGTAADTQPLTLPTKTALIVGSELDYPPYAFVDNQGRADGFSVDLFKEVAETMGLSVTFQTGPWNEVRQALEKGEIDALPHVAYSEQRDEVFDFSSLHSLTYVMVFSRRGEKQVQTEADLKGRSVIAMDSDIAHDYLLTKGLTDRIHTEKSVPDAFRLLISGKHDFVFAPHLVGLTTVRDLGLNKLVTAGLRIRLPGRGYGFAVREGDTKLLEQLNQGLNMIKASGRFDALYDKWFGLVDPKAYAKEVTSSTVFAAATRIEKEVELIKGHMNLTQSKPATPVYAQLLSRHAWQKSYLIQLKINIFRRQHGFPVLAANNLEPVLQLEPTLVYEQTQRLLTEINLLKRRLGIHQVVPPQAVVPGKSPMDVFNKLNAISLQWDIINRSEISHADVYAEIKRTNEDVNSILHYLSVQDVAFPPPKKVDAKLADSMVVVFALMAEVQRLQQLAGISRVNLQVFKKTEGALPSDVLNMVSMVLAELQTLKAHLGLNSRLTPPAELHSEKTFAEVTQFMGYVANKLRLIRSL